MKDEGEYLTNLTKFYTIALLSQKSRHGYEIIQEVKKRIGKKPSTGQIYPLLEEFEENGIVKSREKKVKGRRRKVYELTEKGRNTFSNILDKFYNLIHEILDPWLTECTHCDCKIFEGHSEKKAGKVYREVINGKELPFCCEHCATAYKKKRSS